MAKIRLFVDHPLGAAQTVPANRDQSNYLFAVMRLSVGDEVLLFNGVDGEWRAEITVGNKRNSVLTCHAQTKPLQLPPDLWLMFAPIKKTRTDFIVEKATEMGAARIIPVLTTYTNSDRMKQERLQAHALEAAEQCGGTFVPEVTDVQKLSTVLDTWPQDRQLMFCDETLVGETGQLPDIKGPWAIVIGPEGGFSDEERTRFRNMKNAHSVALGPRILRADTAAVAALTLWQQKLGDWT